MSNTSLQRQIQEEIEREAYKDRMIENSKKRFFKRYKQFKQVERREDCDAILLFYKDDASKYDLILNGKEEPFIADQDALDRIKMYYIKNKNKHDSNLHTYSYIKNRRPNKKFEK